MTVSASSHKTDKGVRLYSRPGNDLTPRFPLLAEAIAGLRSRSCVIDGEAVAVGPDGIPSFDRLRYRRLDANVILFAFDLIELNGEDLRRTSATANSIAYSSDGVRPRPSVPAVSAFACSRGSTA